jgi:hypothetical protein
MKCLPAPEKMSSLFASVSKSGGARQNPTRKDTEQDA